MMLRLLLAFVPFLSVGMPSAEPQRRTVAVEVLAAPASVAFDYKFPPGTTYWTQPFIMEGRVGMTATGTRSFGVPSRMVYRGPKIAAPIQLIGCTRCKLLDLEVVDESGCDAGILITNAVDPPSQGWSTANLISNVRVLYEGKIGPKRAFSVDSFAGGGKDGNNEQHRFERCMAQCYSEAGFYFRGSQCHQITMDQCAALDYGGRRGIGVHAVEGGYFAWLNGNTTANSIDFKFGTFEQNSIIRNSRSEQSTQFVVMPSTGGRAILTIDNVTWDCQPVAGKPVIEGFGPNAISIRDSWFSGTNGVCPTLKFSGSEGPLDLTNVLINQYGGTHPTTPIIATPAGWEVRQFGLRWQLIDATGRRKVKKLIVNQPLPGGP